MYIPGARVVARLGGHRRLDVCGTRFPTGMHALAASGGKRRGTTGGDARDGAAHLNRGRPAAGTRIAGGS
jgi:hypothetical protein